MLHISIEACEKLPPLPAAVEVAAYRIALEALTNVIRHADAGACSVSLEFCETRLQLSVRDDGSGLPALYKAGVGLMSMRERVSELGGSLVLENIPTGGTRLQVQLPLNQMEIGS